MASLLTPRGKALLRPWLQGKPLLAFDYDGTLAPISRHTIEAWMRPRTRALWQALCLRTPCAVISGRGVADLKVRMEGIGPCLLVGNHGMEQEGRRIPVRWKTLTRTWVRRLGPRLAKLPGVVLEDKSHSLSIHWRGAPEPEERTREVWALAEQLTGQRLIGGKCVLNVVAADAPNKGDAVRSLMARLGCDRALFAGDDLTDEDGFAVSRKEGCLGIRVGRRRDTKAPHHIDSQRSMDALLKTLLDTLPGAAASGRTRRPERVS